MGNVSNLLINIILPDQFNCIICYRPQTKFAKVMFYMCLSVHKGEGVWYPSMPCRFPGGCIPACLAGFQAHSQGELGGSGWGVSRSIPGGSPSPHLGWGWYIPACTEADPPLMATAADGMHPTGMHCCFEVANILSIHLLFCDSCNFISPHLVCHIFGINCHLVLVISPNVIVVFQNSRSWHYWHLRIA